jgi:hypothetical protein
MGKPVRAESGVAGAGGQLRRIHLFAKPLERLGHEPGDLVRFSLWLGRPPDDLANFGEGPWQTVFIHKVKGKSNLRNGCCEFATFPRV